MAQKRAVGQCIRLNLIPALLAISRVRSSPAAVHPRIASLAYEDDHQASNQRLSCSHPKGGPSCKAPPQASHPFQYPYSRLLRARGQPSEMPKSTREPARSGASRTGPAPSSSDPPNGCQNLKLLATSSLCNATNLSESISQKHLHKHCHHHQYHDRCNHHHHLQLPLAPCAHHAARTCSSCYKCPSCYKCSSHSAVPNDWPNSHVSSTQPQSRGSQSLSISVGSMYTAANNQHHPIPNPDPDPFPCLQAPTSGFTLGHLEAVDAAHSHAAV